MASAFWSVLASIRLSSSSSIPVVPEEDLGLEIIHESEHDVVDVVLVHGLKGHRKGSFTDIKGTFWPFHLLPLSFPNARILTYGYDATLGSTAQSARDNLFGDGRDLLNELHKLRANTPQRNRHIIFIAHSSGGIVLKAALLTSSKASLSNNWAFEAIKRCTRGIIFLGTPHDGIELDHLLMLYVDPEHPAFRDLEKLSNFLSQQNDEYTTIASSFTTMIGYETLPTVLPQGNLRLLVSKKMATISGARDVLTSKFHKNHADLATFSSPKDNGYETILFWLRSIMK